MAVSLLLVSTLGLALEAEAGVLDVSWTAPTTNADGSRLTDLAGYRVYIGTSTPTCPGSSYHAVPSSTSSPSANQVVSRTITALDAGTTYRIRVSAVDRAGNESACSAAVSGAARGALSVSPTGAVAFGSIAIGGIVDRTFTVQNTSGSTVSGGASVGAPFSVVSGGTFSLAPNATQAVVVRFRPTTVGTFAGNVTFTAGGDSVSRGLSGSTSGSSTSPVLTVTRAGSGAGSITSSPAGITCGSDCSQTYTAGTRVTLTASPASGSLFAGWSGGGCSGTGSCAVTVNGPIGVTATFSPNSTSARPDLVVSALSMPTTVSATSGFPMTITVRNQGTAAAATTLVRIYFSRDATLSSDDALMRQRTFDGIAAGGSLSAAITETVPTGTGAGSYYVLLIADAGGTVVESNEGNNVLARAVTVGGASGGSSPPATPVLTVTRAGSGAGSVTSSPAGIACGSDCSQTYTAGTRVALTASPASGSRFAGWSGGGCSGTGGCVVTVNGATGVTATFSPNSTSARPDLVVSGVSMPTAVTGTAGFPLSFSVRNQGTAAAGTTVVRIYLSRDTALSSDDVLMRQRTFGELAAGGSLSAAITESAPTGTRAGSYYVLLIADAGGAVGESNEGNNVVARALSVR